jgi:hypothetical protein
VVSVRFDAGGDPFGQLAVSMHEVVVDEVLAGEEVAPRACGDTRVGDDAVDADGVNALVAEAGRPSRG